MNDPGSRPLAFAHLMKTAGQTFNEILRGNFGAAHCDMLLREEILPRDWRWVKICYPRLRSVSGHGVTTRDETFARLFPGARFFTFLRDPARRAVSHYQFAVQGGTNVPPFPDWMRSNANYLTRRLAGAFDADKAIETLETRIGFTGLVEHFDESLLLWRAWTGQSGIDLAYRRTNEARDRSIQERIESDPDSVALLEECHELDRRVYHHVVETIYPRQKEGYGPELAADLERFRDELARAAASDRCRARRLLARTKRNGLYRVGVRRLEK